MIVMGMYTTLYRVGFSGIGVCECMCGYDSIKFSSNFQNLSLSLSLSQYTNCSMLLCYFVVVSKKKKKKKKSVTNKHANRHKISDLI